MSEPRTRIKICGITNGVDARAAINLGADALGFIRVSESPRYVTAETVAEIAAELPPFVTRVGVYRDLREALADDCTFDAHQFYADPDGLAAAHDNGGRSCIRAYRVANAGSLEEIAATYQTAGAILLDTHHKAMLGGSGETFDWNIAAEARSRFDQPVILAGGLTPDNVAEAVRRVRPYAVDVSSGVETEPGRKDHAKLEAFISAVRRADEETTD